MLGALCHPPCIPVPSTPHPYAPFTPSPCQPQAEEMDARMLGALITGVRRAFPYVPAPSTPHSCAPSLALSTAG